MIRRGGSTRHKRKTDSWVSIVCVQQRADFWPGTYDKTGVRMRKRRKQELPFEERLLVAAREARETARRLPPGKERERLLTSARESEAALQINRWITSPGLKPPK
jgi:hypothetical protein